MLVLVVDVHLLLEIEAQRVSATKGGLTDGW